MTARLRSLGALVASGLWAVTGCISVPPAGGVGQGATGDMILATTTSTQDSGLLDAILPDFEERSDCVAKTVAAGSGQAMTMGGRGDADVLLVHSPVAEEAFMAAGHGSSREPVMHNDFVLVGPPSDPAGTAGAVDAGEALSRIAVSRATFASRADDSGTHAKEMTLWQEQGIEPTGSWYLSTGQGMGQTLTISSQKQGYTLADRGTFLTIGHLDSEIVYQGSGDLRNPYHVIVVDAEVATNVGCAEEFSAWIRSEPAQRQIADFGVAEYGQPLFFADAHPDDG